MTSPRRRIAILGLGPKGLFALERLVHHAACEGAALEVDAYETHDEPGAGPVYDTSQPEYLRMNLAADRLDLWSGDNSAVPAAERLSFQEWRRASGAAGREADDRYPPRAVVGRYLVDGLERVRRRLPVGMRLRLVTQEARAARTDHTQWTIIAADGSVRAYDEVLLAVGHGTGAPMSHTRAWPHAAPLVPAVFPVTRWLTVESIHPGTVVAVRGFALTFIDAALALTEGRGGTFEVELHPHRLRYVPSSNDVRLILPFSRTGRPMLAKADPQLARSIPALDEVAGLGSSRLAALPSGFDLRGDLLPILASTAAASLLVANGHRTEGERSRRIAGAAAAWLGRACDGSAPVAALDPVEEVQRSLDVGAGLRPPDLLWALANGWQSLYPALVGRVSGTGLAPASWPAFLRLAAEMERIAFGPPPVNARKLLALVAAGRIDLSHVRAGRITTEDGMTSLGRGPSRRRLDVVVDAVLAAPGARASRSPLVRGVVADGLARVASRRRGLEVTADGGCIGRDGRRTAGLSAIGRATEDSVVGNDTLNRRLHPQADRWARRVARAASTRADAPRDAGERRGEAA